MHIIPMHVHPFESFRISFLVIYVNISFTPSPPPHYFHVHVYVHVHYSASIEKYLLEKSRIVSQAPEERNYHVFYYLLSGADAETKAELQLMDIDSYQYLTQVSQEEPHPYNVM